MKRNASPSLPKSTTTQNIKAQKKAQKIVPAPPKVSTASTSIRSPDTSDSSTDSGNSSSIEEMMEKMKSTGQDIKEAMKLEKALENLESLKGKLGELPDNLKESFVSVRMAVTDLMNMEKMKALQDLKDKAVTTSSQKKEEVVAKLSETKDLAGVKITELESALKSKYVESVAKIEQLKKDVLNSKTVSDMSAKKSELVKSIDALLSQVNTFFKEKADMLVKFSLPYVLGVRSKAIGSAAYVDTKLNVVSLMTKIWATSLSLDEKFTAGLLKNRILMPTFNKSLELDSKYTSGKVTSLVADVKKDFVAATKAC